MAKISPEKLKELMLKARKGSTDSFKLPEYYAILEALGVSIETFISLRPFHHKISAYFAHPKHGGTDLYSAELEKAQADLVSAPPQNPKDGKRYVTEIKRKSLVDEVTGIQYYEWYMSGFWGDLAYRFKTPEGKTLELKTEESAGNIKHDVIGRYGFGDFLKSIGWTDWINKYLQTEEHVPASERTREGTGTCSVCFNNVKVSRSGKIVLHGYQRPGYGAIRGECFGVGYPPFEIAVEGVVAYIAHLTGEIAKIKEDIRDLKSGKTDRIPIFKYGKWVGEYYTKDSPDWDVVLSYQIKETEKQLKDYDALRDEFIQLKNHWVVRPLPVASGSEKNWRHDGKKSAALPSRVAARYLSQTYRG